MASEYTSLNDISDELGLSVRTLRYWAARGMLPGAVRFGRTWLVLRTEYQGWKAQKHNEQTARVQAWQSSIDDPEARITTLASASGVSFEGSALLREAELRLKRRPTSRKSASI